jgi:enoyl-CoA hydratase
VSTASVTTERRGDTFLIGLDRPAQRNALDTTMIDQLHHALDEASREPCVVVIHSTTPGIFAAGADLRQLLTRGAEDALRRINIDLFDRLERHRWPTIAVIDGPAVGAGCELLLACDLRVCSSNAQFGQPETSLGILAGAGGNWRLSQLVGLATARRMLYLGQMVQADVARESGLVDEISETPLDRALELASTIAKRSWRALELTKLALSLHRPATTSFDAVAQALAFEGEDKQERIAAFLDKAERKKKEKTESSEVRNV